MPTLNKLTCNILLPPTDTPLPEYRCKYLDSSVSVYVPVPEIPILHAAPSFNIQLRSEDEWIAPGLAMFVYIDGYYQCNRSKRTRLTGSSALELRVRQKEEKMAGGGGGFVGREWRWVQLDVEQANGVSGSHKSLEDHVGKIEVVVLRCDSAQALAEQPQAPASAVKTSAKAPPAKAPSEKAPSARKPTSAASELGGLFGLFDGACDFGFDGAGDAKYETIPPFDFEGRQWDPVAGHYRWPESNSSSHAYLTAPAGSDDGEELHNLDGRGYNHSGVVFDTYGEPYAQRVPHYHTSTARRPRGDRRGRSGDASARYVQGEAMSAPPLSRGQQAMGYVPDGVPIAAHSHQHQAQGGPTERSRQYPKIITGPDGQRYIDISDQQHLQAYALRAAAGPTCQRQAHAPPQGPAQPSPMIQDHLPEGFTVHVDPVTGVQYLVPEELAQQHGVEQRQQHRQREPTNQEHHNVDPEHQRSIIFELRHGITKLLGHDYRLVAAAVPHIPFLKKYNIGRCTADKWDELKRQLDICLSYRHFPNGEEIKPMADPRADEASNTKTPTKKRADPMFVSEKARQRHFAYDDTAQDLSWVDKAAGEYTEINKLFREEQLKEEEEERKNRHVEKKHREKQNCKEPKKDGECRRGSHKGSNQISSVSSISSFRWSDEDDKKDKTDDHKDKTESRKSRASNHDWPDNTGDAAKTWVEPGNQNETGQADIQHASASSNPKPHTDGHNGTKFAPGPWGGLPASSHHGSSTRSRASNRTSSTTASKTINPHAAIQPYFDVLHPNNPKTTNTTPNNHQTPLPREPYLYPPTLAPQLSSSAVGDRSHGVRAWKGAEYSHATLRPKYLDTMDRPYAVFVFEYRSVGKLGEILGRRGEDLKGDMERVQDEVGTGVLMGLSKEKLVDELIKARINAGGGEGAAAVGPEFSSPQQEEPRLTRRTENWAATTFPAPAPVSAPAPAVKSTTKAPTQHHQGHSHSHRSKSKSKSKTEEAKAPSAPVGTWSIPEAPGANEAFVPDTAASPVNPNVQW